jgi:hypothetical protein
MSKLDHGDQRPPRDYEPQHWPPPDDDWWDDLGGDAEGDGERERDRGPQSEIHRRQRAWQAAQERKRAEDAAKAAEVAKELRRRSKRPVCPSSGTPGRGRTAMAGGQAVAG